MSRRWWWRTWWPRRHPEYYARRALEAHTAGRAKDCHAALHRLVGYGPRGLVCALGWWVGIIGSAVLPPDRSPDGFVVFQVLAAGGGVEPDDAPPPVVWAGRFVTATLNDDMDTAAALFNAVVNNPPELVAGMTVVLTMAASVVRAYAANQQNL